MELVINFSGGKDSTAMLAYLVERYPHVKKHVVFADTGWEHPDAEEWSRKVVGLFGLPLHVVRNPNKTFLSMAAARGKFPGMGQRQCTSDLKRGPILTWIRRNISDPVVVSAMGLRSEESPARAKKKKLKRSERQSNSVRTIWEWIPIQDWTEKRVLHFLWERGIPIHPVYKYLRRFSCRVCIFMTAHDVRQVALHDPEAIDIIELVEKDINFTLFPAGPIREIATGGITFKKPKKGSPAGCLSLPF